MKKLNLKNLIENNSFNSIFNTLHRNFLRHDFNQDIIYKACNYLKKEYNNLLNCKCSKTSSTKKVYVGRNEEGFFELKIFDSNSKKYKSKPRKIESICCLQIINKNKLSEKNLLSFLIWDYYKESINEKIK